MYIQYIYFFSHKNGYFFNTIAYHIIYLKCSYFHVQVPVNACEQLNFHAHTFLKCTSFCSRMADLPCRCEIEPLSLFPHQAAAALFAWRSHNIIALLGPHFSPIFHIIGQLLQIIIALLPILMYMYVYSVSTYIRRAW